MITVILCIIIIFLVIGLIDDIGIMGLLLLVIGGGVLMVFLDALKENRDEESKAKDPVAWESKKKQEQEVRKANRKKYYNDYKYTCPMCGSNDIRKLTFDEKTAPLSASGRVGKNYHCDSCKYIW